MRNSRNRDERAAGGPSSPLLRPQRGILLFLLYVPSCPVLATSRLHQTGRSRGFLFSQGVVGKSRGASGRKRVTDILSMRCIPFSGIPFAPENLPVLPFPDGICGTTHPPRSRNYACRIESSRNGGRSPRG